MKTKDKKNNEILINIDLNGSYTSLLEYLSYLEKSKYYINIESLLIKTDKNNIISRNMIIDNENEIEKKDLNQLTFSIKAIAYRR